MIKIILNRISKINLSVKLLIIICFGLFVGTYLPPAIKAGFYTVSLIIEEFLILIMPGIIFCFLFSSMISLKNKALPLVTFLFLAVSISNFSSAIFSYIFGIFTLPYLNVAFTPLAQTANELLPLWHPKLPLFISCESALMAALVLGILFSIYPFPQVEAVASKLKKVVSLLLEKGFTPLLPFFILGFLFKIQHEGALTPIIEGYGPIFILIIFLCFLYITLLYYIVSKFNMKKAFSYIKNTIPSGIMGFTTMSSIATMPLTLQAAEKNTKDTIIGETVVPFTVNIHLIGDTLEIPMMALAILASFGAPLPTLEQYILFAGYFVLCRFAVAAIPGGGILMVLPILESYLGFSPEMSALITTLFILFDPFATAANVIGNGAFVLLTASFLRIKRFNLAFAKNS